MSLKLQENESVNNGRLTITESFTVSKYETKQSQVLTESTGEKKNKLVLVPTIEAIQAGRTRNGNIYTPEKLKGNFEKKSGAFSFTNPYPKPMLKNHDTECEPTGRITHAEYLNTSSAGKPCVLIKPEITDPDAIEKVLDGRYMTVSIGATTNEAICNICGTDILSEGFCGHYRNEEYEGVTCGWICGDLFFDECSWVNVPSCTTAGVTNIGELKTGESVENEEGKECEVKNNMSTENKIVNESTNEETKPVVDGINNNEQENGVAEEKEQGQENTKEATNEDEQPIVQTNEEAQTDEQGEGVIENKDIDENDAEESTEKEEENLNENSSVGTELNESATQESLEDAVVKEGKEVTEKLNALEERAFNAEKQVEEKNIEISNLNVEINEIREEFNMAQAQLVTTQENNINVLASTIVEFKETLNMINTSEKEEELAKLKSNTEETLIGDFHNMLETFKEEAKKRLYSGANTESQFNRNTEDGNRPLTENEKIELKAQALKALFKGQVKR